MKGRVIALVLKVALICFFCGCWIGNVVKLVNCDWSMAGSWKGEIVHSIGLVPGCSIVTVWFNDK